MTSHKLNYLCKSITILCLFFSFRVSGQHFPPDGSKLNCRLIGFTLQQAPLIKTYAVEIARDSVYTEEAFTKNFIARYEDTILSIKGEVPAFGAQYTWRAIYTSIKGVVYKTEFYHFSTLKCVFTDTGKFRVRITKNAARFKDALFFSDNTKMLYNMKGQPVWFLPEIPEVANERTAVRDLKLSAQGTITFLANDRPYEITYYGRLLWIAPEGDPQNGIVKEHYHHEFNRLYNGNYMVMGAETVWCKLNSNKDSLPVICDTCYRTDSTDTTFRRIPFGTVIEYDHYNRQVWRWQSSRLLRDKLLQPYIRQGMTGYELHSNAFYMDEEAGALYISSKHYGIVIKVKYPMGKVMNIYGKKRGDTKDLFCEQHACKITEDGQLYLFNNNECHLDGVPSIVMFQQPDATHKELKKTWEYSFPVEPLRKRSTRVHIATTGGNVMELPDKNMFASLCSPYNNMYIISHDKKILWSSILEKKTDKWEPLYQYRATIITDKEEIDNMLFQH